MASKADSSCKTSTFPVILIGLLYSLLALAGCGSQEQKSNPPGESTNGDENFQAVPVLQVGAIYNADSIQVRLRFETETPSWYHQYWVFDGERWQRRGSASDGSDPDGLYEDRISIMWDDGSVVGFDVMGGYTTVHRGVVSTQTEASAEDVRSHPILGEQLGFGEITKFIPESRLPPQTSAIRWQDVRSLEKLKGLRERGVFLDLWQWRAHRSHPLGFADNGYVLEARHGSAGQSMFVTNANSDGTGPAWMYASDIAGFSALRIEGLLERAYSQEDRYYLLRQEAIPFDSDHNWQTGDAIPHRLLRQPDGSRGAIRSSGNYADGAWDIRLTRSLVSPNPLDSKTIEPGKVYNVAFAVHQASGALHHWVSVPVSFGIGVEANITAIEVAGPLNDVDIPLQSIMLFEPVDLTLSPR